MIELGKTYPDGDGDMWRVICVDKEGDYPVVAICGEAVSSFTVEGQCVRGAPSPNDLILPEDFTKFAIDEPVMVRNDYNGSWRRRYFAGVDGHGNPRTYGVGKTKWSSKGDYAVWLQCRRPTKEELES